MQHKNIEIQKIVKEREALGQTEKREFLDGLVTTILQGYAHKYNQTANDLLRMAKLWDAKASEDSYEATLYNSTADALMQEGKNLEDRMKHETQWIQDNRATAEKSMQLAAVHVHLSHCYARQAALLALLTILYFIPNLARKFWFLIATTAQVDGCDREKLVWRLSYVLQHVFIFLAVTGLVESDFLLHLDSYDIPKRVMIIGWFAYLAAGLQTVLLHTIPHCMSVEYPLDSATIRSICVQFLLRIMVHTIFFTLELLIVWLSLRNTIFTADHIQFYGSHTFYVFFILTLSLHIALLEKRQIDYSFSDEQVTASLTDDDSDDDVSMSTTAERSMLLRGSDNNSPNPTEDMPLIYLQGLARNPRSLSSNSSQSQSPYRMNIMWEGIKLLSAFDTLLIVCSFIVLHYGVTMSMTKPTEKYFIMFTIFAVIMIVCVWAFLSLSQFYRPATLLPTSGWRKNSSSNTLLTYNSIEL
jgi:hypothetical protein